MRKIIFMFLAVLIISCAGTPNNPVEEQMIPDNSAQTEEQIITDNPEEQMTTDNSEQSEEQILTDNPPEEQIIFDDNNAIVNLSEDINEKESDNEYEYDDIPPVILEVPPLVINDEFIPEEPEVITPLVKDDGIPVQDEKIPFQDDNILVQDTKTAITEEPVPETVVAVVEPPEVQTEEEPEVVSEIIEPERNPFMNYNAPTSVRTDTVVPKEQIVFSRVVHAVTGQSIEIPFRGTGWIYIGELSSRKGISYDSRKLDSEGMSFLFKAEAAGSYSLKFYKQDFMRDLILNDYVQIIIENPEDSTGDRKKAVALPRWPSTLEEAKIVKTPPTVSANETEIVQEIKPENVIFEQPAEKQNEISFEDLPKKAKEAFDQGKTAEAIALLDQFRQNFPSGSDELYWLYGQFYEANSPSRDILLALDYYKRLIDEYPQSGKVAEVKKRIAYLQRFYININ